MENYVKRNIVSAKEKPDSDKKQDTIYYVLEDLIKWGKEGMNYENLKVDSYTQTNYGSPVFTLYRKEIVIPRATDRLQKELLTVCGGPCREVSSITATKGAGL